MNRPAIAALLVLAIFAAFTAHLAPLVSPLATVLGYALSFLPYVVVLWCIRRKGFRAALPIMATALGIRAVLVFAEPLLSDDIFRYVWEGRVTVAGYNPFVLAPDSPELAGLRDGIWAKVNHPEIPTIYPPVSQYAFALVALLGGGTVLMKALFVAVELAAIGAVARLWKASANRKVMALAAYALNPLVMFEVAWSGHLDVLAWAPLSVALLIVATRPETLRWSALAGGLLGVSIAAKLLGLLLLPYLVLRQGSEQLRATIVARVTLVLVALAVAASSYLGFASAGPKLFQGFGTYAASWRSNDGLFRAFDQLSWRTLQGGETETERVFRFSKWNDAAMEHGFTKEWEGQTLPATSFAAGQLSQTIGKGLALLIVGLLLLFCAAAVPDPLRAAGYLLLALYFVAPTVHPWYVAWLVPLAALRLSPTALAFSGAVVAGYVAWLSAAGGGSWAIPWWVVVVEYGLVFAVLVWEVGLQSSRLEPAETTV